MNLLSNKIQTEKKRKKNILKIEEFEIELVKMKYANNPKKFQSELKEIKKFHVVNKNLHEIKNEILIDYTCEIEMVGKLSNGDQVRETHIRFRNLDDFESYINSIDEGYDSNDSIFNGYKIYSSI